MTIIDGSYNAGISSFQSRLVLMKGRVFMEGVICFLGGGLGLLLHCFTLCEFDRDKNYKQKPTNRLALIRYCSLHSAYNSLVLQRCRNEHKSRYRVLKLHNVFFSMLLIEDIH